MQTVQLAGLNTLDLLLIVILGVGILVGTLRGIVPQLLSIVSIWLALVITLWLYKPFSISILQGLNLPAVGSDTTAFLILLIVFFNAIRLTIKILSTSPEDRKRREMSREDPLLEAAKSFRDRFVIGPLNLIGGVVLGFILTSLWIALILGLVQFIVQPTGVSLEQASNFAQRMNAQLQTSALLSYFNQVLDLLRRSVSLFIPGNADILDRMLGFLG